MQSEVRSGLLLPSILFYHEIYYNDSGFISRVSQSVKQQHPQTTARIRPWLPLRFSHARAAPDEGLLSDTIRTGSLFSKSVVFVVFESLPGSICIQQCSIQHQVAHSFMSSRNKLLLSHIFELSTAIYHRVTHIFKFFTALVRLQISLS